MIMIYVYDELSPLNVVLVMTMLYSAKCLMTRFIHLVSSRVLFFERALFLVVLFAPKCLHKALLTSF